MIDVQQLTRRYGDFTAVDHVSFSVGSGEIVGLLGHNGAGKTTIMKMLTGFLEPSEGQISIDGSDLSDSSLAIQKILGYLPENLPVYPEMKVADYLEFTASMRGLSGVAVQNAVKEAARETELQDKMLQPIATLSRGFKQRVGVAQAILHKPRLLILDEPTNGLDPSQTQQMRSLIKRLSKQATVILSTHIMQEVDAVCDRVLILNNGSLVIDEHLSNLHKTNHVSLLTNADEDKLIQLRDIFSSIDSIDLKEAGDRKKYRLQLKEDSDQQEACAQISAWLVENRFSVYGIAPEQRDLETIFREVSDTGREAVHA